MLSAKEAANRLEISKPTLIKMIRTGKIVAIRIGHQFRITEEEVERIKKEGTG